MRKDKLRFRLSMNGRPNREQSDDPVKSTKPRLLAKRGFMCSFGFGEANYVAFTQDGSGLIAKPSTRSEMSINTLKPASPLSLSVPP